MAKGFLRQAGWQIARGVLGIIAFTVPLLSPCLLVALALLPYLFGRSAGITSGGVAIFLSFIFGGVLHLVVFQPFVQPILLKIAAALLSAVKEQDLILFKERAERRVKGRNRP